MTASAEEIVDRTMSGKETLGMACGFEPAPFPFPLSGWLVGQFGAVVQALVPTMLNARDEFLTRRFVAL